MGKQSADGSWGLVTGASSGIGESLARCLAKKGSNLVLVARRLEKLRELEVELSKQHGIKVVVVSLDLSVRDAVALLMSKLDEEKIELEFLFNNAGIGFNDEFCNTSIDAQLKMVDLNCRSLMELSFHVANRMKKSGRGTIVHTSSMVGLSPSPYFASYGASKAFVFSFSEALSVELQPYGIIVKTLCPGATESEFGIHAEFKGAGVPSYAVQSSEAVVETLMQSLQSPGSLVIPGAYNRWSALAFRLLPRRFAMDATAKTLRPLMK